MKRETTNSIGYVTHRRHSGNRACDWMLKREQREDTGVFECD